MYTLTVIHKMTYSLYCTDFSDLSGFLYPLPRFTFRDMYIEKYVSTGTGYFENRSVQKNVFFSDVHVAT